MYSILITLGIAAVQPRRPLRVVGISMEPTYHDAEWLWTLPYNRPLKRGDVIVINTPEGKVMKRVALLPGEKHLIFHGPMGWVDAFNFSRGNRRNNPRFQYASVPEGTIFVLGDHLSCSIDSRTYGVVKLSDVERIVEDERAPNRNSDVAHTKRRDWLSGDA